jgi:glycosyltransferase involved in cell wall biosynthesis
LQRAFILPNGVDLERFRPQPKDECLVARHGLAGSRVIMTLGRLTVIERYKGFDEIIDLMPRLLVRYPDLKYLIVGDGLDRERLAGKARALKLDDKVIFAGRVAEHEKVAYYNLADAYVMPSSGEGFGIVLIEALACGVPVVGSSVDGSRETLLDGRLGRLVDPADADALYHAVDAALAEGRRGRLPDIETFSAGNFVRRVGEWAAQTAGLVDRSAAGRA